MTQETMTKSEAPNRPKSTHVIMNCAMRNPTFLAPKVKTALSALHARTFTTSGNRTRDASAHGFHHHEMATTNPTGQSLQTARRPSRRAERFPVEE